MGTASAASPMEPICVLVPNRLNWDSSSISDSRERSRGTSSGKRGCCSASIDARRESFVATVSNCYTRMCRLRQQSMADGSFKSDIYQRVWSYEIQPYGRNEPVISSLSIQDRSQQMMYGSLELFT